MANYTEHYNLEKPEKTDYYDVDTANKNNDIIDNKLYEKQDKQPGKGLSTNDFTNEYKKKIDALQRIYKYCGSVETIADLETIENRQRGDVYNVKDIGIDYCWNETEWTELGNAVDLSNYQTQEEAEQEKQQIEEEINQIQEDLSKCQEKTVPQGGTTGQVLSKNSDNDYDVEWVDKPTGSGEGGVSGDTFPIGAIIPYGNNKAPANWLICDGSAVSRTTYADLFDVIGTNFGAGDGSATFNLPDLRKNVPVGMSEDDTDFDAIGKTGGEKEHTLTVEELAEHSHGVGVEYSVVSGTETPRLTSNPDYATSVTSKVGGNQPHNNLQPYVTTNYIIKAGQSAGLIANVVDNLESISKTDALSANQGKVLNEKITGTVLYYDSSGTTGNVPLSVAADNLIEIFYVDTHSGKQNSKRIDLGVSRDFAIDGMAYASETSINYITNYTISDTNITVSSCASFNRSYQTGVIGGEIGINYVKILKVVGYK